MGLLSWLTDDWRWSYDLTNDLGRNPAVKDIWPCYIELAVVLMCIAALLALAFARDQRMGRGAHRLLPALSFMMLVVMSMHILFVVSIRYDASLDPPFQSFGEVMGYLCASRGSVGSTLVFGLEAVILVVLAVAASRMLPSTSMKVHVLNLVVTLATSLLFSPPIFTFVDIVFKDSRSTIKITGMLLMPVIYLVLACAVTILGRMRHQTKEPPAE